MSRTKIADLEVRNYGTVALIEALTEAGRKWLHENVYADSWQWLGDRLAVEPRFAGAVMASAADAGLGVL